MKKILVFLQYNEKLTMFIGGLLGLSVIISIETYKTPNTSVLYAETTDNIESITNEVVDLTTTEEIIEDEIIIPTINSNLIEDAIMNVESQTQTVGVEGGIAVEIAPIIDDEVILEDTTLNDYEIERPVEILDATGVPNEEEGCRSWNFTYMAYTKVTTKSSAQYQFLYNNDLCYTDIETGIRMSQGRYCIAVGSFYTTRIGQKIDLVLANGNIIKCILGDCKSDEHTDPTHRYHAIDGSVAEFVVDYNFFTSTKQWAKLGLTDIVEVRLVADDEDDIEQVEADILAHKLAVEEYLAALEEQNMLENSEETEEEEQTEEVDAESVIEQQRLWNELVQQEQKKFEDQKKLLEELTLREQKKYEDAINNMILNGTLTLTLSANGVHNE